VSQLQPASRSRALRPGSRATRSSTRSAPPAIDDVWQRHGRAMFALALVVCEDAEAAETVVVQAILDACTPSDIAVLSVGRQELARYVYVLEGRRRAESTQPAADRRPDAAALSSSGVAGAEDLSHRQRSAIALALFGDHTYRDVASLMGLPAPDVAELMRSGLIEAGRERHRPDRR
jgi:hypothetical protein